MNESQQRTAALLGIALFSVFFLTQSALLASEKFFWFDELCTLYIARLPSFADSWQAVLHGADYNPPLFYLIMRAVHRWLGDGLIAFRAPAIAGIWIFCVSLFRVGWRRLGLLGGGVALLFPLVTIAGYYAAEARPHAIVLGFTGLAIMAWEWLQDRPGQWLRQVVFGFCLAGAFLTHCYAILGVLPFAVVELLRVRRKDMRWGTWAALLIPAIVSALSYIPLLRAYDATLAGTGFAYQFRSGFWQLPFFYALVLTPAVLVIVALLIALGASPRLRGFMKLPLVPLAIAFTLLPIAAVVFALLVHGPFIPRYFLSCVAGVSLLIAQVASRIEDTHRLRWLIPGVLLLLLAKNFGALVWHRHRGISESLTEPALGMPMNTVPGQPLAHYAAILQDTGKSLPIVIAEPMDFLYLVYYAPQLTSRIYYVAGSQDENNYRLYRSIRAWCHLSYNPVSTYPEFERGFPEFYIWGDPQNLPRLTKFTDDGAHIEQWTADRDHFLAKLRSPQIAGARHQAPR